MAGSTTVGIGSRVYQRSLGSWDDQGVIGNRVYHAGFGSRACQDEVVGSSDYSVSWQQGLPHWTDDSWVHYAWIGCSFLILAWYHDLSPGLTVKEGSPGMQIQ